MSAPVQERAGGGPRVKHPMGSLCSHCRMPSNTSEGKTQERPHPVFAIVLSTGNRPNATLCLTVVICPPAPHASASTESERQPVSAANRGTTPVRLIPISSANLCWLRDFCQEKVAEVKGPRVAHRKFREMNQEHVNPAIELCKLRQAQSDQD